MKIQSNERKGELYAIILSLFEGFFPIFSTLCVAVLGSVYSYFYTLLIATPVLLFIQYRRRKFNELRLTDAYKDLLLTALFINLLFLSIFIGVRYTTPANVAVIMMLQLFFSYLYFNVLGAEKMTRVHTIGAFLMISGALIILFPHEYRFNYGDLVVLVGAAIAPFANLYQKRARTKVSAVTILSFRNAAALPVLLILALTLEPFVNPLEHQEALFYVALNAILVFVIAKFFWIEALHHISITKLSAMIAFIPLFTVLFAYLILGDLPNVKELLGIIPILAGSYFITR